LKQHSRSQVLTTLRTHVFHDYWVAATFQLYQWTSTKAQQFTWNKYHKKINVINQQILLAEHNPV